MESGNVVEALPRPQVVRVAVAPRTPAEAATRIRCYIVIPLKNISSLVIRPIRAPALAERAHVRQIILRTTVATALRHRINSCLSVIYLIRPASNRVPRCRIAPRRVGLVSTGTRVQCRIVISRLIPFVLSRNIPGRTRIFCDDPACRPAQRVGSVFRCQCGLRTRWLAVGHLVREPRCIKPTHIRNRMVRTPDH